MAKLVTTDCVKWQVSEHFIFDVKANNDLLLIQGPHSQGVSTEKKIENEPFLSLPSADHFGLLSIGLGSDENELLVFLFT